MIGFDRAGRVSAINARSRCARMAAGALVRWCAGELPVLLIYEVRVRVQVEFNRDILEVTVWTGNR